MGWSYGIVEGKEVGYGVEAECEHPGCTEKIDRGLSYACGGDSGSGEFDCNGFFCEGHRYWSEEAQLPICQECLDTVELDSHHNL